MKKILLVNAFLLNDVNGTGYSVNSALKSIPDNQKYQICLNFLRKKTQDNNIFYIDKQFSPLSYLLLKKKINNSCNDNKTGFRQNISGASGKGFRACVYDALRGFSDCIPVCIYKQMEKAVRDFNPDAIYTCAGSIKILRTCCKLSKKFNIPIILHIMDNWEDTLYTSSVLSLFPRLILKYYLKKANSLSVHNFAISPALADKLAAEYNVKYTPLMNAAESICEDVVISDNDVLTFTYAGTLSINRWATLSELATVLEDAIPGKYKFVLYVPEEYNTKEYIDKFKGTNTQLNSYVPKEQIAEVYQKSDVLVLAESFDENFCDFTKYSLSTKIPEYMSSGKPILAYVSDTLFSYEYLKQSGAAVVECKKELLAEGIKKLCNPEYRLNLAKNGVDFVIKHHAQFASDEKVQQMLDDIKRYKR